MGFMALLVHPNIFNSIMDFKNSLIFKENLHKLFFLKLYAKSCVLFSKIPKNTYQSKIFEEGFATRIPNFPFMMII